MIKAFLKGVAMDYVVVALSIVAIFVVLKIMKSAFKFILTIAILAFVIYYLDMQGLVNIQPFLDSLGM